MRNVLVPFSGGVDSAHVLVRLLEDREACNIFPVFVDGLNAAANNRERHACVSIAKALGLRLFVVQIERQQRKACWDLWKGARLQEPPWRNQLVLYLCAKFMQEKSIAQIAVDKGVGVGVREVNYFSDTPDSWRAN